MSLIPTPPVALSIGEGAPPAGQLGGGFAHVTDARSEAWKRRSVGISTVAGGYTRKGGDDIRVAVWAMGGPLTLTLVCGIIHTAAAFVGCMDDTTTQWGLLLGRGLCNSYVLSLGPVSAGLILVYLALFRFWGSDKLPERSLLVLSGLLFLWWAVGTAVTTFSLTVIPDTLYLATWASLLYSGLILNGEWTQFQMLTKTFFSLEQHTRVTFYVAIASVVNTASSIAACVQRECTGLTAYSITVGPISLVLCTLLAFNLPGNLAKLDKVFAVSLAVWWGIDVGLVTIGNGPFLYAGNGLLSAWAACVLSFAVAQAKVFPVSENLLNDML